MIWPPPRSTRTDTLFPYTTLYRSGAAAKALEAKKAPVMYRVHEPPSREKLVALKDYLKTFDLEFALGQVVKPATFNHILARVGDADFKPQVMEQVLRRRSEERRVGKGCVRKCSTGWSPYQ